MPKKQATGNERCSVTHTRLPEAAWVKEHVRKRGYLVIRSFGRGVVAEEQLPELSGGNGPLAFGVQVLAGLVQLGAKVARDLSNQVCVKTAAHIQKCATETDQQASVSQRVRRNQRARMTP